MKLQNCCDALGRIVWFSGPHPGSRADSTLRNRWGPKSFVGDEVALADGAYSGNLRLVAPYRKPKGRHLPPRKERYNQLHSFFRARVEYIFTRTWPYGIMQQVWRGKGLDGACELQRRLCVLFKFLTFELCRKVMYEPAGVWARTAHTAPAAQPVEYVRPSGAIESDSDSEDSNSFPENEASATGGDNGCMSCDQFPSSVPIALQNWLHSGRTAPASASASSCPPLAVWQPRMTRSNTACLQQEMQLSAVELEGFLHNDE